MRFLLVDIDNRLGFILRRLQEEGHEVLLLAKRQGIEDLVPTVYSPQVALEWKPDIALFNAPGAGTFAKHLMDNGVKVVGGGLLHDDLDRDKEYAAVLASRVRVPIFDLDNGGIRLKLAGFFSGKSFVNPTLSFAIDKGLLHGLNTPEALVVHALPEHCWLVDETFTKLSQLFTAFNFKGVVCLDVQIDPETRIPHVSSMDVHVPDGFWAAFISGLEQPLGEFLKGLASGKRFKVKYTEEVSGAVKVSVPPYPYVECPWLDDDVREAVEAHIRIGARGKHIENPTENGSVYWLNVQKNGTGTSYVTTGPEVAYVGASGELTDLPFILQAQIEQLNIPNAQHKASVGYKLGRSLAYFEDCGLIGEDVGKDFEFKTSRFRAGHYRNTSDSAVAVAQEKPKTTKKKAKKKKAKPKRKGKK